MKNRYTIFTTILFALAFVSAAAAPKAFGVVPAPDGAYPGGNTAEGESALFSVTSGIYNTAVGFFSLRSNVDGSFNTGVGAGTLLLNTGEQNTATGAGALLSDTTGANNTATGAFALFSNTEGSHNTATGDQALFSNAIGADNTANGELALFSNTEGDWNTAVGVRALFSNTSGSQNTANGYQALSPNTTGNDNTATGFVALFSNTEGTGNTAMGVGALNSNTSGSENCAVGAAALASNTTGSDNTATGNRALNVNTTSSSNTAVGDSALFLSTGQGNTALGAGAGTSVATANNVIAIEHPGANVSDSCYIGNIFQAPVDPGSAVFVVIDSNGKLGTFASSRRFKQEIQPMDKASEALLALKPVTFRYKNYKNSPRQFGLIAEEVAEVNPDLIARDKNGEIYTVRYEQINAMLLNEFLKEHKKVESQQAMITQLKSKAAKQETTIGDLKKGIGVLTAQFKEQATQIRKVSAQVEMSRSAPRVVSHR